jgi:alpha-glucosidase
LLAGALPGSLYLYQGDELGLPEVEDLPLEALQDPMHFRSEGEDPGRDGCRVPLPWTKSGSSFGFGEGDSAPWLPQPPNWGEYSVEAQERDPRSMLALYRAMLAIRRTEPALLGESLAWLDNGVSQRDVIAFRRGEDLLCLVNLGPATVPLPAHTSVLLASDDLAGDALPTDTAVWLRA